MTSIISQTNYTYGKKLKKEYLLYVAFFPYCDWEKQDKLLAEMLKLKVRINKINSMTASELHDNVIYFLDVREADFKNLME